MSNPTVRRNTGRWSHEEHELFLKGVAQFGRTWDVIHELFVRTRNETQIRTHAQKYFQKVNRGLPFPDEPYGSANAKVGADTAAAHAAQGGGGNGNNKADENDDFSDDGQAHAFAENPNHFFNPPPSTAAAAAGAGAGNVGGNVYANGGVPAGGYPYVAPFQGSSPPPAGPELQLQQLAPVSPDYGANPLLGSGLPAWPCQVPSDMMGGMLGGGAAADPGNGQQYGNRYAAGPDRTEDDLLAAVADMDDYDSGTSFTQFDPHGGSPASWTGYSAGGTLYGPPPSLGGPWLG